MRRLAGRKTQKQSDWLRLGIMLGFFICTQPQISSASTSRFFASWYSIESLKAEGTYKHSKGVMANREQFTDGLTCATRLYDLGAWLLITNTQNGKLVIVKVTDRIAKRFGNKRIDLSRNAFSRIADLKQGLVPITIKELK